MSEDMVKSTLEKFEAEIVNSEIENAIVITNTGLISLIRFVLLSLPDPDVVFLHISLLLP